MRIYEVPLFRRFDHLWIHTRDIMVLRTQYLESPLRSADSSRRLERGILKPQYWTSHTRNASLQSKRNLEGEPLPLYTWQTVNSRMKLWRVLEQTGGHRR